METILVVALAAAGGTLIIRAILEQAATKWEQLLFVLTTKPTVCNLCMSWWCSLLACGWVLGFAAEPFRISTFCVTVVAAVPVSMVVLQTHERLKQANTPRTPEPLFHP